MERANRFQPQNSVRHYNFVQCGASAIGRFTHKSGHLEQATQQKDRLAAVSPN